MKLAITPAMLEATYELLRTTPPFKGWKLPPAEEVAFLILRTKRQFADHTCENGGHIIRVSQTRHKTIRTLIETMAHEMVHMRETQLGVRKDIAHGAEFKKLAKIVCSYHGFDPGTF
jgi:SprT-like family